MHKLKKAALASLAVNKTEWEAYEAWCEEMGLDYSKIENEIMFSDITKAASNVRR